MNNGKQNSSPDHQTDVESDLAQSAECKGAGGIAIVVSCHLINALLDIPLENFNIFFLNWRDEFDRNSGETAAIQSISSALANIGGLFAGVLLKRYSRRCVGMIAATMTCLGVLGSFFAQCVFHLYCTAFITGTGAGMLYITSLAALVVYFKKRYKIANGIAYAGIGTGSLGAPPLIMYLSKRYGWRGATLISSAIAANVFALVAVFRTPRRFKKLNKPKPASASRPDRCSDGREAETQLEHLIPDIKLTDHQGPHDECDHLEERQCVRGQPVLHSNDDSHSVDSASNVNISTSARLVRTLKRMASVFGLTVFCKSYRFTNLCLFSCTFGFMHYAFKVFVIPRAQSIDTVSFSATFLLSVFGIGSCLGRLINGILISWRLSADCVVAICMAVAGCSLVTINVDGYGFLVASSFVFGLSIGSSLGVCMFLIKQYVGVVQFPVCIGLFHAVLGVGALLGPVLLGLLYDASRSYKLIFYVCAGMCFVCSIQMVLMPKLKRREPGMNLAPSER